MGPLASRNVTATGRRFSIALACLFCLVGGILQATAFTFPHLIIGRIIAGLGIGIYTITVPMWQSETCNPRHRGKLGGHPAHPLSDELCFCQLDQLWLHLHPNQFCKLVVLASLPMSPSNRYSRLASIHGGITPMTLPARALIL